MKIQNTGFGILLCLLVIIFTLTISWANQESSPVSSTQFTPGERGKNSYQEIRLASNFFDILKEITKEGSKERKLLEGAGSILESTAEIDFESERTIGESLALEGFARYGMPVKDKALQKYVNLVGVAVARNSLRPGLPYVFVVVKSPLQNAFSCPGGIIFLSAGLLKTIQTEAQLASILAHEVAHVGHKDALKSIQRARFFQGVGKITAATMEGDKGEQFENMIGDLQNILFDKGLDQGMEFEADLAAMETAYRTGYSPDGIIKVLEALKKIEMSSKKRGSWFSTHPPLSERIRRCKERLSRYPDWKRMAQLPKRFKKYTRGIPR
jgi:predicted Zn-dependent protease